MTPQQIFEQMYARDAFSRWLGIRLVAVGEGTCTLAMQVRADMLNGFGVAHGGISFSLADSAFAFACNSRGRHAVSIHCTVEYVAAIREGDELLATATESALSHSIGNYGVEVKRADGTLVAVFRGVTYRKSAEWSSPS
jgi:acyl-CoA thioesterase